MGRGNFTPYAEGKAYRMVYIDWDEESYTDSMFAYDDMITNIKSLLPKSFKDTDMRDRNFYRRNGDDGVTISENKLIDVCVADNETSTALYLMVKEDAPAFSTHYLSKIVPKIFDELSDMYDLWFRCCAWTSGKYVKSTEVSNG